MSIDSTKLKPTPRIVEMYDKLCIAILTMLELESYIKKKVTDKEMYEEKFKEIQSYSKAISKAMS